MRLSHLRNIDWAAASSDPAMALQMSLADELSRCGLESSLLPFEHRAHTFVNIYNLLFLFSCIVHKAHPSSMSASEQNDFFSSRHHCLSFEMVRLSRDLCVFCLVSPSMSQVSLDDLLHGLLRNNKVRTRNPCLIAEDNKAFLW